MGVSPGPDVSQKIMEHILASLIEEIEVYFDDITAFLGNWACCKKWVSRSTLQNAKRVSKKPTSWDIGLRQKESSPGARRLMLSHAWNLLLTSRNFILSLEWLCITEICVLVVLTFLHLSHLFSRSRSFDGGLNNRKRSVK